MSVLRVSLKTTHSIKNIQISTSHYAIVRSILEREPYRFGIFGSRAKTTSHKHSDLDIVIFSDDKLPFGYISDLKDKFSDSNLPYFVDIVDYNSCDSTFRNIIDEHYIGYL